MSSAWNRLSREQRRAWTLVAGVITVGTIVKVGYFKFSRGLMVSDSKRRQEQAMKHLQEAHEFARWAKQDRESKIPELTNEQREQLQQYLLLVEQHSVNKIAEYHSRSNNSGSNTNENCVECPIDNRFQRASNKGAK